MSIQNNRLLRASPSHYVDHQQSPLRALGQIQNALFSTSLLQQIPTPSKFQIVCNSITKGEQTPILMLQRPMISLDESTPNNPAAASWRVKLIAPSYIKFYHSCKRSTPLIRILISGQFLQLFQTIENYRSFIKFIATLLQATVRCESRDPPRQLPYFGPSKFSKLNYQTREPLVVPSSC